MTIFGTPIDTIYLILLIAAGSLTILYILFGDIFHGVGEALGYFHPTLVLSFITFFSAAGYIFEKITSFSSPLIISLSAIIALILVTLLNIFVLIPLSSAEESLSYTEESLKGRVGKLIISIPKDGFGEVVIDSKSGMISKPASSYENTPIAEGKQVLVIEVSNGVLHVVPYEYNRLYHEKSDKAI
ncbi:putative membrane protein YuaF [Heyndrickxia sporothermodurans]|nr:putative membrane protein YuaF [Heyndrickxia sporothermodurans]